MSHTPDWPTTRARIIDAFDGELPGANLEAAIVDLYETNPAAVINAIDSVATSLKTGKINSGWAVLKAAAAKKITQQTNPTVNREKLIRNADQWLRNAGLMYDRWHELEDELFGDHGRLKTIATDKLRRRYLDAWTTVRVDGVVVEQAELERAERWKSTRVAAQAKPTRTPQQILDEITEAAA